VFRPAATMGLVIIGGLIFMHGLGKAPPKPAARMLIAPNYAEDPNAADVPPLRASPPVRVSVPSVGISAPLIPLSLHDDGSLEVPPLHRTDEAGWFQNGPTPGERGPAVIAGHVDSTSDKGVFYRLGEMLPGQLIKVTRRDGTAPVFRVYRIETVAKDDFPDHAVYGPVAHAALRLITCGGSFDSATGHYTDNLIVYASLYRPAPKAPKPAEPSAAGE
jgi:hypothetical protein